MATFTSMPWRPRHWFRSCKSRALLACFVSLLVYLCIPVAEDAGSQVSRVLLDRRGQLVRVWLNQAHQVRFPPGAELSPKYRTCVEEFEDQRFRWHPGIDPVAVARALRQNFSSGHVQSGASTLTMQVARLRTPRDRTLWAKALEAAWSLRLEAHWSKPRIFAEYASLVPMGGNLVGVDAACWRFFGHSPAQLTWSEASLLAVLPNQPSALNLGKERPGLKRKRDRLLERLWKAGKLDTLTCALARQEPLPGSAGAFQFRAPQYAEQVALQAGPGFVTGTLDLRVQDLAERRAEEQVRRLQGIGARNVAVLVMETKTGMIRAYVGSQDWADTLSAGKNDGVVAKRSTGSLLKPFLYGLALQRGPWTPRSLLLDVPTWYGAFAPMNADQQYSGLVSMHDALVRSLNVPAVRMLADYGLDDFYWWLKGAGFGHLFRQPEGYGLPLILGGAEASLLELTPLYAMLLRDGRKVRPKLLAADSATLPADTVPLLNPGAAWLVAEILTDVKRPDIDEYHAWLDNQVPVAWKTGTSFGARDAWSIGVNAQWTIGVWIGNFEGHGIDGLSGAQSAAPLMFALFNDLTDRSRGTWVGAPNGHLRAIQVCPLSGDLAGPDCPRPELQLVPDGPRGARICALHRRMVTDRAGRFAVCSRCWNPADTAWSVETVTPPEARPYLEQRGLAAKKSIPHNPACTAVRGGTGLRLTYPDEGSRIFLPRGFEGLRGMVAEAVSDDDEALLHWFVDGRPMGKTKGVHRLAMDLSEGAHELVVQDASGQVRRVRFQVARKE